MDGSRLLVVDVAGLGVDLLRDHGVRDVGGLPVAAMQAPFPAVTCTAQATLRTGLPPSRHGVTANGFYDRRLHRTFFWEQSAALVSGPRIWDACRSRGARVALFFWQQSLGEAADLILSPAPIHRHHGGMIPAVYSKPHDLYERTRASVGRDFRLGQYWGPMASARSSQWIADATATVLADPALAPDLCFTYLPGLDYDLQRHGPDSPAARSALGSVLSQLSQLQAAASAHGCEFVAFGDYAMASCPGGPAFPNRALADARLLAIRRVKRMALADLHESRAFALVDHEVAHVHVRDAADIPAVRAVIEDADGVGSVLDRAAQASLEVDHPAGGELLLVAAPGRWFAYPWWTDAREAPDYAAHVDIHQKPGYDPCELFWGWPPGTVSLDPGRVRGSHGRIGPGREAACLSTVPELAAPSLVELGQRIGRWMEGQR
jgi:predicted AlkP superfamily pyrophosphatase or phosphodiesterase